jgi:hypothetical protein
MKQKRVQRTYFGRFLTAASLYVIFLAAVVIILRYVPSTNWNILLAILPAVPLVYGIWAYSQFLDGIDELRKRRCWPKQSICDRRWATMSGPVGERLTFPTLFTTRNMLFWSATRSRPRAGSSCRAGTHLVAPGRKSLTTFSPARSTIGKDCPN